MTAQEIAAALGPYSVKSGGGLMARCPAHADKNPSLAIDESNGALLVHCFAGCEQGAVVDALKAQDLWPSNGNTLPPARKPGTAPIWEPVLPIPNDAPEPPATHHRHGKLNQVWRYLSAGGDLLHIVYRFDSSDGKQVLPLIYASNGKLKEWRFQAIPDNRPLYGLELIGSAKHILIVEGEKATDAARRLLGDGLPVVTWSGGSNATNKTDFSPLAGKNVAIWPDADEPGTKAALAVADHLKAIDCTVKIVKPPADVVKGWDLADAEAEGWTKKQVLTALKAAITPEAFKASLPPASHKENAVQGECGDAWETPLLFDSTDTPELLADLLPGWLGEYVGALARSTQTPPAMAVMLALSTVATCNAKRFDVCPYGEGYSEPLNLWTATAMPPASRKTAVVSAVTKPFAEWEKSEADRLAPEIKKASINRRLIERRIDQLEKEASKIESTPERANLQHKISKLQDEMPPEIISPRLWTGDTTPERLQGLLVDHGERMAVLSDEGGIFEVMAGLYSDGRANLDVFLQGHAGQAVRVDRQSRTAHLDAPALSFGLAIQPTILADMGNGGKKRFRGNGTLARFLYAVPRSNVGSRDVRVFYQIPATISANYRAGIFALLAIPPQMVDGREIPRRLTLTPDALEGWHAFAEMVEQRQGQDGDLESISDWSGKLPGAALRIAGNFHLVEYGTPAPAQIEALTIERALDLCTLLIDHAKAAFNLMQADTSTNDAKAIYQWIIEGRLEQFRRGEVYRHFKGRFTGNTDRLDKALNDLKTRALVKEKREKTIGREATCFNVNPEVLVTL